MPLVCVGILVVFLSSVYLGNMLTLLDGVEHTHVNWEHGLSDMHVLLRQHVEGHVSGL